MATGWLITSEIVEATESPEATKFPIVTRSPHRNRIRSGDSIWHNNMSFNDDTKCSDDPKSIEFIITHNERTALEVYQNLMEKVQNCFFTSVKTAAMGLTVPSYAVAAVFTIFIDWLADRSGNVVAMKVGLGVAKEMVHQRMV
jgi:hypothetical protein